MTSYLYVLSIGPVQDFIMAARRTKDLWFGSYILSVICKAAAREISHSGGHLIFPGLDKVDPRLELYENDFSVANVVLANGIEDPKNINEKAQDAAKRQWIIISERARDEAHRIIRKDEIGKKIWDEQVKDAIEFYAAWVPEGVSYKKDHMKVMRLLAGRKSIRDFEQAEGHFGIRKSSLDGARESVIQREKPLPKWLSMKLRLNEGEELCAIGLTKRLGCRPDGKRAAFPSVVRVAADPWIRGIRKSPGYEANGLLNEIETLCEGEENSFSTGVGNRLYQDFPFDGHILYPSRLARAKEDIKDILKDCEDDNPYKSDAHKLSQIERAVNKLEKKENGGLGLGEPNQYLAILRADGDRMGKALSAIKSDDIHRKLSKQLAKFASEAKKIVENDHHGCMVFSGGDDVLAFLPLDACLDAARALHDRFGEMLSIFQEKNTGPLTLSVGIAIGHYLEPLENLLEFGMDAEKDAKKGRTADDRNDEMVEGAKDDERDGLAVHIHPRSGAPIKIRQKWKKKGEKGLDERLHKWAEMHCLGVIPDSAAYEMYQLAEVYRNWKISSKDDKDKLRELIASDAMRLLKKKTGGLDKQPILKEDLMAALEITDPYEAISRMAAELILARRIAAAMIQAKGKGSLNIGTPAQEMV